MIVSRMKSELCMGTVIQIKVVSSQSEEEVMRSFRGAFACFRQVEAVCSRFDEDSELRRLCGRPQEWVAVSNLLFQVLHFALEVSIQTEGVFDPALGYKLEELGFDRHYLTGARVKSSKTAPSQTAPTSFRTSFSPKPSYLDVILDKDKQTVMLLQPLLLDLGAVAKGFAIDLAVKALEAHEGFLIDAGGDIYAGGDNEDGQPWLIGIRHPIQQDQIICTLQLTDAAVCTSGSYERRSPQLSDMHHLIEPQTGKSPSGIMSCTVVAPFAMLADAFSTVAFVLGPMKGQELLEEMEIEGLWVSYSLEITKTDKMEAFIYEHN